MQHPAIVALLVSSFLIAGMVLSAAWHGVGIMRAWDLRSGSERQVRLERRTYLVSSILGYALAFQALSLFLFILTADTLHSQFTGAMCAAGSLNANGYGYPTLFLKIATCLLAGVWLVINHVDTRGYDYPLIKAKYALLVTLLAPLVLVETSVHYRYFRGLHADVITSCCGSLFGTGTGSIGRDLAGLPAAPMVWVYYSCLAVALASSLYVVKRGRGGYFFSAVSAVMFVVSAASLVSFIGLYVYELPSHHCPFCMLQQEYGYVGYAFYGTLFGGGVAGLGAGALTPFRRHASLARIIPATQRRLAAFALGSYLLFALIASSYLVFSPLRLFH
ncbi:hypothetical protein [Geobacter sp. FeAm09]|uniref:hypothetical protein n=1 Tax=Geobacter sp. FeAm09 TaxID=2597769 RepID=UPI001F0DD278|nr:hypothetical protein [Geobacter sp. FeAm09]